MWTPYNRLAQTAVCAASRLAEAYGGPRLSSAQIARSRRLPQPIVAKVLTVMSQAGLVDGVTGPGGGYALTRPPGDVTLLDVVRPFERLDESMTCPLGPAWCGSGNPCPLHNQLVELREQVRTFLESNTLASFSEGAPTEDQLRGAAKPGPPEGGAFLSAASLARRPGEATSDS